MREMLTLNRRYALKYYFNDIFPVVTFWKTSAEWFNTHIYGSNNLALEQKLIANFYNFIKCKYWITENREKLQFSSISLIND